MLRTKQKKKTPVDNGPGRRRIMPLGVMTRPYRIYSDFALSERQEKQQPVDNKVTQFPRHRNTERNVIEI